MTKASLKYLLSLCILLLCVFGHLCAQSFQEGTGNAFVTSLKAAEHTHLSILSSAPDLRVKVAAIEKSFNTEATDIAEEDEDYLLSKKLVAYSKYLTAALYALTLAYFFRHFKTGLRFCKHFSFQSSKRRYLFFQVFRI